jgi:hypothetical protein
MFRRQDAAGFKYLKAGFGNKIRGEEGSVHFKIIPPVKEGTDLPYYFRALPEQFQIQKILRCIKG